MRLQYKISGGDFNNAGTAASSLKKVLKQLSIDAELIRKIVVALYEAEINVVAHAYSGVIIIELDAERISIIVEDVGPGIPDIEQAMQAGYSTASDAVRQMGFGAGMGLPNIKKNTSSLSIESLEGKGTKLEMIIFLNTNG